MSFSKSPYDRGTFDRDRIGHPSPSEPASIDSDLSSSASTPSIPPSTAVALGPRRIGAFPPFHRPKNHCRRCLLYFECGQALYAHIREVHWTQSKCLQCGAQFGCQRLLRVHVERAHSEHAPRCRFCGKTFKNKRYLRRHIHAGHRRMGGRGGTEHDGHRGGKQCAVCKRWCRDRYQLRVHQRTHSDLKPLECQFCCKRFADPSGLRRHIKRYHVKSKDEESGEAPPIWTSPIEAVKARKGSKQCPECGKWLCDGYRLRIHRRSHSGEKPLECPRCDRRFADPSNLRRHVERYHPKEYSCSLCDAVMPSNQRLQQHVEQEHGGVVLDI